MKMPTKKMSRVRQAALAWATFRWLIGRRKRKTGVRAIAPKVAVAVGVFTLGVLVDRFVFDQRNGRRRRHAARERGVAGLRRGGRRAARRARYLEGVAEGYAHKATHAVPGVGAHKDALDDTSLAQKVESEAFRHAGVSKAHVSVNAEEGVVYLRGRLESEDEIVALVKATRAVDGVKDVQSLLHTPSAASNGG
jgi:osmotically-inducible protein OsmY